MPEARLAAALLVLGASAAQAQVAPSSLPEITSAVQDCAAAAQVGGVAEQALLAKGWSKASFKQNGKELDTNLSVYGKVNGNPTIMTDAARGKVGTICFVMAGLKQVRDYQGVVDGLAALQNTRPIQKQGLKVVFSDGAHIIQSELTGNSEKPAVRVAVMAISPEKK
ncbi:hypothetical protein [Sphingomonas humi]|uniref:Uncharacterized protein n=1 Tax=Sphingomonas humi TaxID=335630 RepID=A0ABP7RSP6_9SPHN